jgi:hypothetical protein
MEGKRPTADPTRDVRELEVSKNQIPIEMIKNGSLVLVNADQGLIETL